MNWHQTNPYGGADWAGEFDIRKAGMFHRSERSVFAGFFNRQPLYAQGQGGLLVVAAPRSGKLTYAMAWNACGPRAYRNTCIYLDPKGEIAAISQNQAWLKKPCYYFNPTGLFGFPSIRINPLDHIIGGAANIVSATKSFYNNWMKLSGSANGRYFELSAREIAEAITIEKAERQGIVSLPDVYRMINLLDSSNEEWLGFEFDMLHSRHEFVRRVGEQLRQRRKTLKKGGSSNSGGEEGIIRELHNAFACLHDPVLRDSVSAPFDFSFAQICEDNAPACNFYIMAPAELIGVWSPVLKAILKNATEHKSQRPSAPPQLYQIDEAPLLGKFPLLKEFFTYNAGRDMRPVVYIQSMGQLDGIDDDAREIILASAAYQIYFGVQDLSTATYLSGLIGQMTLELPDTKHRREAKAELRRLIGEIMAGNVNPDIMAEYMRQREASQQVDKIARNLMSPDEVINTLNGKALISNRLVGKPILADEYHYFQARSMDGAYHPNPYYDRDLSKITLADGSVRRIVRERVPAQYARLPQYADGTWSYVQGYRP